MEVLMSWLQDWQDQIYRNLLADDAFHLILSGFQNTLVIETVNLLCVILLVK